MDSNTKLVWLDLEMSGLDIDSNVILQIAIIVTDCNLNLFDDGIDIFISQQPGFQKKLDAWNFEKHTRTGLIDKCINSEISLEKAEKICVEHILKHTESEKSPLCGNTISHDRAFLYKYMYNLHSIFHYRNLDVSSIKIIKELMYPNVEVFKKLNSHDALNDIRESIKELKFYKKYIFLSDMH